MSGDVTRFSNEWAEKTAKDKGCTVMYSDENTLLLDIDDEPGFEIFQKHFAIAREHNIVQDGYTVLASKSGNRHVIVKLTNPLSVTARIALQATMGSDRKREILSYIGVEKGQANPILLYRPTEKYLGRTQTEPEPLLLTDGGQ